MNLKVHIDAVNELMHGGIPSDDRRLSDAFVAHMLFAVRNDLIRKRLDKGTALSEEVYNTICMDVADSTFHECNCAEGACSFKRTVFKLPATLQTKKGMALKVMTLNGAVIDNLSIDTNRYANKYALVGSSESARESNIFDVSLTNWYIHNNYVFIQNNPYIKKILVKGVFAEPISSASLEQCTGTGSTNCVYPYSDSGFIDNDLLPALYSMTIQLINARAQDKVSDALDSTKPMAEGQQSRTGRR